MMSVTSGPTSQRQFVFYDPDGSCWRTFGAISLWGSEPYSGTWPKRGSMRSGACYEHPTWVPPTAELASSSLLPTPAAQEPGGTVEQYHARLRKADGRNPTFTPLGMLVQLLPTPRASPNENRQTKRSPSQAAGKHGLSLAAEVCSLPSHGGSTSLPFGAGRPVSDAQLPDPPTTEDD